MRPIPARARSDAGLAGAVRADHAGHRSGAQLEIDVIDRHQSAVAFDDAGDVQERSLAPGHAATRFFAGKDKVSTRPTTPLGAKRMSTIRITPAIAICASG